MTFLFGLVVVCALIGIAAWISSLATRIRRLEHQLFLASVASPAPAPAPPAPAPVAAPAPAPAPAQAAAASAPVAPIPAAHIPHPRAPRQPWLTGGRALAVAGGAFVLIGVLTFITMAISNGWISHGGQVVIGYAFGVLVALCGIWAGRRTGHNAATLVAVGLGAGIVEVANVAGTSRYHVIDTVPGLLVGIAAAAGTVWWALRRDSQLLAGFGIAVGLAAPILVGASTTGSTLLVMAVAFVAATTVVVIRGWPWLATVSLVVTFPQLADWCDAGGHAPALVAAVVLAWWAGLVAAAVSWDARRGDGRIRTSSATLVFLSAVGAISLLEIASSAGERPVEFTQHALVASLFTLAALHGVAAAVLVRACTRASSRSAATWIAVAGCGVLAVAIGEAFNEQAQSVLWTVEALALFITRCRWRDLRAGIASAAVALLASGAALDLAPPELVWMPHRADLLDVHVALVPLVAGFAVALWAAFGFASGRLSRATHASDGPLLPDLGVIYTLTALLTITSAWLVGIDGAVAAGSQGRVVGWTLLTLLSLGAVWRRPGLIATVPAIALLLLSGGAGKVELAPPRVLWVGSASAGDVLLAAACAVGSWLAATLVARRAPATDAIRQLRIVAGAGLALICFYYSSALVVTAFSNHPGHGPATQAAQLALTTWWGIAALVLVWFGLQRQLAVVHRAGAVLLLVAAGKVLLVDTVSLEAAYRVGVFIAVGLAMLLGGFAYLRAAGGEPRPGAGS